MADADLDVVYPMMDNGSFGEALPLLDEIILKNPEHWKAMYLAGICCRYIGDFDGAIKFQKKALELNKDYEASWLALGISLQFKEEFSDSILALKEAVKLDPKRHEGYNALGATYHRMGNLDEALRYFDKAGNVLVDIAREISKPEGHITIEEDEKGEKIYNVGAGYFPFVESYLQKDLKYASVLYNIGNIYIEMGNYKSAEEALVESIEMTPEGALFQEPYNALRHIGVEYTP
jgi:tetratricopeptide (TPR) repeat protein